MLLRNARTLWLPALLTILCATSAEAASITYGDFTGSTLGYLGVRESSITDGVPLYGTPTLSGDALLFGAPTYATSAAGGWADTTSGTLSFTLEALSGFLGKISFQEGGRFALTGAVGVPGDAQVQISGLLTVTDFSSGLAGTVYSATLVVSPQGVFALPSSSSGSWTASAGVDLTGLGITRAKVVFNNTLQSAAGIGSSATAAKSLISVNVPEPGTVLLVGAGLAGLGVTGRRRKA
ncbi:MAG TPA: PEP-CTERM sorting domain-containing protein [Myxococcota bacterium]|jgi:hypothetical protein|nr:PEP-CTERM sorting domain-containing protein [Myxococcota bacterium]